jgi:hypothetical protein
MGANAQNYVSGRVRDATTGEILPYVTVAVKGKNIGVISDREGWFEIGSSRSLSHTDSVIFSHVGFRTEARTIGQLTGDGQVDISLRQGEYRIEPIVVTNRKSRLVRLGHTSSGTGMVKAGWFGKAYIDETAEKHSRNYEGGVPIKIKGDSDILSFGMFIRRNGYDRALLRLSFYSLDDNSPGGPIIHKDIRFEVKERHKGRFEVDLTPYDIRLGGGQEILVTLSLLEDEMNGEKPEAFLLDGALLGRGVYGRWVGNEAWERFGGATMTMYLNAKVYR